MTENQKRKIIRVEQLETFAEINNTLKADKDVEAVQNNLAKFDENGNPVDSGINVNDLSTVATTGDYNDLLNKPTIPSVGNAEIEIQKNGEKINSFTTNQSGSKVTINISVPTGTAADKNVPSSGDASSTQVVLGSDSRLTNSRPASDVYPWAKAESKPSYSYSEISNTPTIPTTLPASDVYSWAKQPTKPSYTKSEVGLDNVTNDAQVKRSEMGAASGVATLNENGKIPSSQLPSYVDDAIELLAMKDTAPSTCVTGDQYYNTSSAKIFTATNTNTWNTTGETPEKGKVYINLNNDRTYRWGGSAMVPIKGDLVIGTGAGDAADGKVVDDHIKNTSNPHSVTKSQVGLGNVGNFKAVSTEASQGLTAAEKSNARANIGAGTSSFSGNYNDLTNKPDVATQSADGLMSKEDKTTLDKIDSNTIPAIEQAIGIDTSYDFVDLGLPSGTLWAKCNIGAEEETGYGNYYMYGKGERQYNSEDAAYAGTEEPLDPTKDTATVVLGALWHMPTKAQITELFSNTNSSWVTDYNNSGINGRLFVSKKDENKHIFIPAAGDANYERGTRCYVWSSTPYDASYAYAMQMNSSQKQNTYAPRTAGFSVRPVCDSTPLIDVKGGLNNRYTKSEVDSKQAQKADKEGYFPDLHAGLADNMFGSTQTNDQFMFRPTAGIQDIESGEAPLGCGTISKVEGNTVKWNQQFTPKIFSETASGITISGDGSGKITIVVNSPSDYNQQDVKINNIISGHVYLCKGWDYSTLGFEVYNVVFFPYSSGCSYWIITAAQSGPCSLNIYAPASLPNGTYYIYPQLFDLTLMFGEGNEPSTVAEFESWLETNIGLKDYYPYNEGELIPVKDYKVKSVGFNAWDGEIGKGYWDDGTWVPTDLVPSTKNKIKVLPNTKYLLNDTTGGFITYFDYNGVYIGGINFDEGYAYFTTPSNCYYVTKNWVTKDACISLSYDDDKDGTYEPHWEHEAVIPTTKIYGKLNGSGEYVQVFPDGMKKAGSVADVLDLKNGSATRKVGDVDLGTLTWEILEYLPGHYQARNNTLSYKVGTTNFISKYSYINSHKFFFQYNEPDKSLSLFNGDYCLVGIRDDSLTQLGVDAFTSALLGTYLYYELATPLTYTDLIIRDNGVDTPLSEISYKVDNYGTEEIILGNDTSVVGCTPTMTIKYGINATDALAELPHSYVSGTGNQNFSEEQKTTARNNISAASKQELENTKELLAALAQQLEAEETFTLEGSSSPAFTVSDDSIAKRYISKMGGYGVITKDGKTYAAKLNASAWDRFADGTLISAFPNGAADFETMVRVPDCYFKGENKTLHFGGLFPVENGHKFDSPNWVGAYEMYVDGSGVGHSRPDVAPSHSRTMSSFWSCAQGKGTEWGLANYQFHCLINALYQARYGNLNSQATIGVGGQTHSWDSWRDVNMGLTRSLGDGTGNVLYNNSTVGDQYETKLFGFEGLWGKLWEFRPGIRFYMDNGVRHAVIYSGNQVSNTATGRDVSPVLASAGGEYITAMELGELWDMIPQAVGGGDTTYYCDGYWASTGGELLIVGGYANDFAQCGVSRLGTYDGFGFSYASTGARLAFYGNPIIVSGAELLALAR